MSRLFTVLFAALCLGLTSAATAAGPVSTAAEGDQEAAFDQAALMDANKDGVITRNEFFRHNADEQLWFELDIDQDGRLDASEYQYGITPRFRVRD